MTAGARLRPSPTSDALSDCAPPSNTADVEPRLRHAEDRRTGPALPPPPPPPPSNLWTPREPPSGSRARLWTLLAGLWLWVLLPVAIHYQRKARREADESGGLYVWPNSLWNRPVLFFLVVLVCNFGLVLLVAFVGMYGV